MLAKENHKKKTLKFKRGDTFEEVISNALEFLMASSPESIVYVGADSQRHKTGAGKFAATYCTVIAIHIDGKHGCKLFHFVDTIPDYGSMKQRLITEASYAVRAASELADFLDGREMQLHLDLNKDPKHKSNVAVKEACGWVMSALGLEAKIKPHSWAASCAADHIVRH